MKRNARFTQATRSISAALLTSWLLVAGAHSGAAQGPPTVAQSPLTQVHILKITVLSTNLAEAGLGEWGFSALVEADGHRILLDTGLRSDTVLQNARDLEINLSNVKEVILTHNHWDHVGGLMALRREMMKKDSSALSQAHVAQGIFYSRPSPAGEGNGMIELKKEYEATGGRFIEHSEGYELFPGAWMTGPVPRPHPERYGEGGKVLTPAGLIDDTVPEDQSLVVNTPQGLVVVTGCAHAGIITILTSARSRFPAEPVHAVVGGLHLFPATDAQLDWTADRLKEFKLTNLMGTHCTGLEALYHIRGRLKLPRSAAVVGGVGSTFVLGEGIHPGPIAR
jgi:7,8-dihydropterin-6-yl-methyl-4-(beta-D-ribofuranosyl)aminobenzene 5'-phosphate synthase